MSHFTLTVKLPAADVSEDRILRIGKKRGSGTVSLDAVLKAKLAPYEESPPDGSPFLVFTDIEDAEREKYENGSTEQIRLATGELLFPWDERFRTSGTFGTGGGTHENIPQGAERVIVPFRTMYPSFEEFMAKWHGSVARDAKHGRYGNWHNPNAKWDWFQVGGRWTGYYPVKPGRPVIHGEPGLGVNEEKVDPKRTDVLRVRDLDMDAVATETRTRAEKFWEEYQELCAGKEWPVFEGPRHYALSLGLLHVVEGPAVAGPDEVEHSWSDKNLRSGDNRAHWTDVLKLYPQKEQFLAEFIDSFCPLLTYAALDADGWHEPGRMGWFGCSTETPESKLAFQRGFVQRFVKSAAPDDVLVLVDCHI